MESIKGRIDHKISLIEGEMKDQMRTLKEIPGIHEAIFKMKEVKASKEDLG